MWTRDSGARESLVPHIVDNTFKTWDQRARHLGHVSPPKIGKLVTGDEAFRSALIRG